MNKRNESESKGNRRSNNAELREKSVDKSKKGNRGSKNVESRNELNKNA